ncbi:hypothetical protein [Solimonas variicoloris]|uniref:hypothetical protein n=1 Tax=Solimonas variicoloris TaxID=254408 RepID=UPI0003746AAB|nr:hypothetical protein [Solimonas variicoloris]
MHFSRTLAACVLSGVLLHAGAAGARPAGAERERPELAPPTSLLPSQRDARPSFTPDEAAREIQRRHGGRVLAVQPDGAGYRVKLLRDGEVRIYQVDP